jgi:hypothetical protein
MLIVARFKAMVQSVAHRYGYKIERIVDYADDELNIFRALLRLIDPAHPDFFSPKLGRMMAYGATLSTALFTNSIGKGS